MGTPPHRGTTYGNENPTDCVLFTLPISVYSKEITCLLLLHLDLADLNSVKSAADYLIKNGFKINILVLNAGLAYYNPELLYGINSG